MTIELETLKPIIREYSKFSFDFWVNNLNSPITFEGKVNTQEYQVEIQALGNSEDQECVTLLFSLAFGCWSNAKDYAYNLSRDGKFVPQ